MNTKQKRLVTTMNTGVYTEHRSWIYPMFRKYATRSGADFIPIENQIYSHQSCLDKMRISEFLKIYDRVIYFDSDIVIRPDCPNLFDLIPETHYGAWEECSSFEDCEHMNARMRAIDNLCDLWGLDRLTWPHHPLYLKYFNAGMFVISRGQSQLLDLPALDPLPDPTGLADVPDQSYLNWGIVKHGIKVRHLPDCFNQMVHTRNRDYRNHAYIVHYAGLTTVSEKIQWMKDDMMYWKLAEF